MVANNNQSLTKSKHIDIKYLSVEHMGSNSMLADPLTKGVPDSVFCEHITYMGLKSYDDM